MRGFFITVEGPEGAGKTTVLDMLEKELKNKGIEKLVLTREPGGIDISEQIREIILDKENTRMDARTESLLYAAARRQHLVEKVIPALEEGVIVLCDRFVDSSLAYQGHARALGMEEVWEINKFAIQDVMPDLTIYFDIAPEIGLKRIDDHKGREVNRLDLETLAFHQQVREGYKCLLGKFPERIVEIDASQPINIVFEKALASILSLLEKR